MLSTKTKIQIGRLLAASIIQGRRLTGRGRTVLAKRDGVEWSLDLREGIDLSIFLMGGFELRTLRVYREHVRPGDVVLDIGANVGAHTLPLARLVGDGGRVFAFEPSDFAFAKLRRNIDLNPKLAPAIEAGQIMLSTSSADPLSKEVYASWPLDQSDNLHEDHAGRLTPTSGATMGSVDEFVAARGLTRINFVKLDVDGNEHKVLAGSLKTLEQFKPKVMMELAPYVYADDPAAFDDNLRLLWSAGYKLIDISRGTALPQDVTKVRAAVPAGGGINILAVRK
jgi:FkbM family methyltransferase